MPRKPSDLRTGIVTLEDALERRLERRLRRIDRLQLLPDPLPFPEQSDRSLQSLSEKIARLRLQATLTAGRRAS